MANDDETYQVERSWEGAPPPRPAGLLRFYPLGLAPRMSFFALVNAETVVGRDESCDIRVEDNEISRKHAIIRSPGGRFQIEDNHSANGVHVNGLQVESRALHGGEIIRLGASLFSFVREGLADKDTRYEVGQGEGQRGLVGGPALDPIRDLVARAGASDLTALVVGQTGTGKEFVARALHQTGSQGGQPFVPVDCAAIPELQFEQEMFGVAQSDEPGFIRQADGGTLFLDEIGELLPRNQAKLLRVLQDQRVVPVGARRPIQVEMRVVSATNRDLRAMLQEGRFRPDLYARLAQLVIRIPTLEQRREDVPLLVDHFLQKHGGGRLELPTELLEQLCCRGWPYNVRQLENTVRRAIMLAGEGERTELSALHFREEDPVPPGDTGETEGTAQTEEAPRPRQPTGPPLPLQAAPCGRGDLQPSTVLARRYEIVERLGAGGASTVYLARDLKLDLQVALKLVLPGPGSDPELLERLYQEVRLARRVSHRNVARIHDLGEWEGLEFISMEYIQGETLDRRLSAGAMPLNEGVDVLRQICAGLAAAHSAGVIHRDLKPENVMLEAGGRVVILDFGIAGWAFGLRRTLAGTREAVMGTPHYMAPEQIEQREVDQRADIYALGVLAFEIFCGSPPFDADSFVALALKHVEEPAPDPRTLKPDMPLRVAAAISRCLQKAPQDRFSSVEQLGGLLAP